MDFMKVYNLLSRENYLAVIDEAKRQKIPVAGHIPLSMTAEEASDLGQVSFEHLSIGIFLACSREGETLRQEWQELIQKGQRGAALIIMSKAVATYDDQKAQSFFARLRRNGTWVCPTTVLNLPIELIGDESELLTNSRMRYVPKVLRQQWHGSFQTRPGLAESAQIRKARSDLRQKIVGAMHRAGVALLAGSDAPNPYILPGFSLHDELEQFVLAGLTPLEALQTATIDPAKFLGREKELGTIEKGKLADLVLLDADPLVDINNTRKIIAVIANGRYFSKAQLERMLADVEARAEQN
jgi:imidazolonepropionase-like amidohydrolase